MSVPNAGTQISGSFYQQSGVPVRGVPDLTENDIVARYPSDRTDLPDKSTAVKIPVRRKAPDVGHADETRLGRNDGTLTETDRTMEYRFSGGRWTGITGNTVKNLAPGDYEIRYAATDMDVASFIQTVTYELYFRQLGAAVHQPGGKGGTGARVFGRYVPA